jgi:hypothetical protein
MAEIYHHDSQDAIADTVNAHRIEAHVLSPLHTIHMASFGLPATTRRQYKIIGMLLQR